MDFINKQDDLTVALGDLKNQGFEPLLKLTFVFGTRDQCGHVQGINLLGFKRLRDIGFHDALGNSFGDGGFAHPWLSNEERVVFGSTGQNLNDATNFFIPANDRVQFAFGSQGIEIAGIFGQGLVLGIFGCFHDGLSFT